MITATATPGTPSTTPALRAGALKGCGGDDILAFGQPSGAGAIVQKLKQSFQNRTDRPQFINLELSTARFRLKPSEELVLFYEADEVQDALGATLRTEFITNGGQLELVVWTSEDQMFFSDGRPAPQDFDHA